MTLESNFLVPNGTLIVFIVAVFGADERFCDSSSGGLIGHFGHDGFELDGGQSAETSLSSSAVVGPLDPGHHRDSKVLAGDPSLTVQDVALKQREETLHGGVVAG